MKHFFYCACLMLLSVSVNAESNTSPAKIEYDKTQDMLTVQTTNASLKQTLARIAQLTSLEFQMHPDAEQQVSFDIKQQKLQPALKSMLREFSTVLIYDSVAGQPDQKILTTMHVLPMGEYAASGLNPVLNLGGEVFMHQRRLARQSELARPLSDRTSVLELSDMRWRARLAKLPEQKREALLERAQNRIDKQAAEKAERKQKRETRNAEFEKSHEDRVAEQQLKLDKLKQRDPEGYEARIQEREAAVQQTLDELAQQQ